MFQILERQCAVSQRNIASSYLFQIHFLPYVNETVTIFFSSCVFNSIFIFILYERIALNRSSDCVYRQLSGSGPKERPED